MFCMRAPLSWIILRSLMNNNIDTIYFWVFGLLLSSSNIITTSVEEHREQRQPIFDEDVGLMNGMKIIISVLQWQCIRFKCRMSTYNYEDVQGNEMESINEMFTTYWRRVMSGNMLYNENVLFDGSYKSNVTLNTILTAFRLVVCVNYRALVACK